MRSNYARQKFHVASTCLKDENLSIVARLTNALISIHTLKPEDLPLSLRQEYVDFWNDVRKVDQVSDEGTIVATLRTLNESELRNVEDKIIYFKKNLSA